MIEKSLQKNYCITGIYYSIYSADYTKICNLEGGKRERERERERERCSIILKNLSILGLILILLKLI